MKRVFLILLLLVSSFLYADIDEKIHHADTFYWLGIGENGDMDAFAKALAYLDSAERELKLSSLDSVEKEVFELKISSLRSDILYQQDMAHDTFYGVFPLNRVISGSIFKDAAAYGTFELVDDPDVIAVCNGAEKVVETLNRGLKYSPQYGVIINSNPPNQALENEVRYIFNLDPRFFVHTYQEIASSLTEKELKAFKANKMDSDLITHLCQVMNNPYLALLTIRKVDIVDDVYFFIIEANTYWDNEGTPKFKMAEMSFCRDRREALIPIWIINVSLLCLTLVVFFLFYKLRNNVHNKIIYLLMPILAFFWGRLLPWVLNPILVSFRPEPETLVKLSFWWTLVYSLVMIFGVMFSWYLISKRASKLLRFLAPEGWTDLALVSVGFGITAYFGEILILYDSSLILAFIAVMLIIISTGYILGSVLDCTRRSAGWFIFPVIIISIIAGLFILRLIISEIVILGIVTVIIVVVAYLAMKKIKTSCQYVNSNFSGNIDFELSSDLTKMIIKPEYQKFLAFQSAYEKTATFKNGKSCYLLITGPSGRGKTATANAIIEEIKSDHNENLLVLKGECPDQDSHLNPYAPLQQALGQVSGINFNAINKEDSQIDSVMDSLMDSVIPFSSLLLPGDESGSGLQSGDQLNSLIFNFLLKMTRKTSVILFLDDLQWLDDATKNFLIYLVDRLKEKTDLKFLLLLTSRSEDQAEQIGLTADSVVSINPLQNNEKELILTRGLGFETSLSKDLLKSFGNIATRKGELFFLLSTLGELAREGAFIRTTRGYILSENYKSVDQLPIPDSFASSVLEQLNRIPDERMIVECAACLGLEFEVDILVRSLELSRLHLLRSLNRIETETDLIYDVGEFDDVYAFSSSAVLEVIRNNLKIHGFGPLNPEIPQIIREYHARLARVLENKKTASVFDIANQYYAAGRLYAEKALEYCIKAAHAAAGLFQHQNAGRFLEMARECAEITGRKKELAGEFLKVEISESLVENIRQEEIADKAWEFIKSGNPISDSLKLLISKSFYNAGLASGDQKYFARAVEITLELIEKSSDDLIQAEGRQIVAISLERSKKEEILKQLREAYKLIMISDEESMRVRELRSRIENSLAERLTYGSSEEKNEAERLFLRSIEIKEELMDKPGLARSWGGLGRLYLEMNKIEKARTCFEKDLELCRQIGDKGGEVKMYSFIADCFGRNGKFNEARESYKNSFQLADGLNDKLFAARGLLIVGLKSGKTEDLAEYAEFLRSNYDAALKIWSGFFDEIKEITRVETDLKKWLSELVN